MSANWRAETIMELTARGNVALTCRCGHRGVLDGKQLARYFAVRLWNGRLHIAGDYLRCSRCNAHRPRIRLTGDAPTSTVGPSDEQSWQALRDRLRAMQRVWPVA